MIDTLIPAPKRMSDVREAISRVVFFSNGRYKYTPSDQYLALYTKYKLRNLIKH